jgi:hypothetical protein
MNQFKADLRAHLEHVAKLDIQESQRLNPTGILQRTGVHGIKPDLPPQRKNLILGTGPGSSA